jgi:hypothetical protein
MEGFKCSGGDVAVIPRDSIVLVGTTKERWLVRKRGKTQVGEMVSIVDELIQKYKDHPYDICFPLNWI